MPRRKHKPDRETTILAQYVRTMGNALWRIFEGEPDPRGIAKEAMDKTGLTTNKFGDGAVFLPKPKGRPSRVTPEFVVANQFDINVDYHDLGRSVTRIASGHHIGPRSVMKLLWTKSEFLVRAKEKYPNG